MNKDVIYPSMVIRTQEETINRLEEEVNKQAKAIQIYEKELKKHDNNWNELKRYIKASDDCWDLQAVLDKIKEIESK